MNRGTGAGNELKFLVERKPLFRGWGGAITVLLRGRAPRLAGWITFFDKSPMRLDQPRRSGMLSSSVIAHILFFLLVLRIPWALLFTEPKAADLPLPTVDFQPLIYPLPTHRVEIPSPPKSPAKEEKRTAESSSSKGQRSPVGSGVKTPQPTPQFTLVLKPPRPDNNHQTIIQAGTPPDVRIKHDVPLPNVLLAGVVSAKDPRLPLTGMSPKPVARPTAGAAAMKIDQPTIPDMALAVQIPVNKMPLLPSPEVALPVPAPQQSLGSIFASNRQGAAESGRGLLVLGANPTPPSDLMSLPPGNRYGEFSVSLMGSKAGVPSGPGGPMMGGGGTADVRAAGKGAGNGLGSGNMEVSGDVGGAGNGSSAVAAFGPTSNGSGEEEGILPPWMVSSLVYPVKAAVKLPAINLIVTAGPIGGGGLGMFGVLSCPAIYTIYLPMPGKPWVLQYCQHSAAPAVAPAVNGGAIRLGTGIAPPQPESEFDFHRPPVEEYKRDKMIVLRGLLGIDGQVKSLNIYQGVSPIADQAALAAFAAWRFRPASDEHGKPIAVDLLVGIPATVP
ncbi:MAG TPA: energy transducer TonB [Candidatus Acidoferrales bacterium]|nr:energy transducer TonB [Candidatus Acidoferrales bacterium]